MVKKSKEFRTRRRQRRSRRSRRQRRPRRSVNKMAGVPYFSHVKSDYSIPKRITIKNNHIHKILLILVCLIGLWIIIQIIPENINV